MTGVRIVENKSRSRYRLRSRSLIDGAIFIVIASILYTVGSFSSALVNGNSKNNVTTYDGSALERRDRMYGIAAPAGNVVWMAGNFGKILRSEDGGISWHQQDTPATQTFQDIDAWDPDHAVVIGNNGVILMTSNAGAEWKRAQVAASNVENKLCRVRVRKPGEAWAVGAMGTVIFTADWGLSWERRTEEEDVSWNNIAFADDHAIVIVGEFGRMRRTTDNGSTWEDIESPIDKSLMGITFGNQGKGIAVGLEGALLKTADAGKTWNPIDSGVSEHLFDVIADEQGWIAVGTNGSLVRGSEDESSWQNLKLAKHEWGWHTEAVRASSGLLLVGSTQGRWSSGTWSPFLK